MKKKSTKPMTPFDELTIPFELTLLKLILPYTSAAKEQTLWILIKFMELKYTIQFFKNPGLLSSDLASHSTLSSPSEILELLAPYLTPKQAQTAEQFQNMMEMMEVVQMFQSENTSAFSDSDPSDPNTSDSPNTNFSDSNIFGNLNPADLMMGMLSDEQKEMFQMYQNLFNDTLDPTSQTPKEHNDPAS